MIREILPIIRLIAYLFAAYSILSLFITKRWLTPGSKSVHFFSALLFLGLSSMIVIDAIPGLSIFAEGVRNYVFTPLVILIAFGVWRVMILEEREKIKKIKNGEK